MKTTTFYRVMPNDKSFSSEDFISIDEAIERANKRNMIRIDTTNSNDKETFVWSGDNCKLYKVTQTIEPLDMVERNQDK